MSQGEKPLAAGYGPCSALVGLAGFEGRVAMSTGVSASAAGGGEQRTGSQPRLRGDPLPLSGQYMTWAPRQPLKWQGHSNTDRDYPFSSLTVPCTGTFLPLTPLHPSTEGDSPDPWVWGTKTELSSSLSALVKCV